MSTKNSQQSRYRMISIMTFVVLLLSFAYYYFVFVKSNEEIFNSKAFRIVEQAGQNVENKFNNYKKITNTAFENPKSIYASKEKFNIKVELSEINKKDYKVPDELFLVANNKFKKNTATMLVLPTL